MRPVQKAILEKQTLVHGYLLMFLKLKNNLSRFPRYRHFLVEIQRIKQIKGKRQNNGEINICINVLKVEWFYIHNSIRITKLIFNLVLIVKLFAKFTNLACCLYVFYLIGFVLVICSQQSIFNSTLNVNFMFLCKHRVFNY